jgi:hypothetical protein
MIEIHSLRARQGKASRRSLWFVLTGILLILSAFALAPWSLSLPQRLGGLIVVGVFTLGFSIIVFSPTLARVKPPYPSEVYVDHVLSWEKTGDPVTMVNNLSLIETLRTVEMARRHFGKYVLRTVTTPKGKTWTINAPRVGSKILPTGLDNEGIVFNVILYRRDLAGQRGIRRPWRRISPRDGSIQFIKPGALVELPSWMTS